MKRKVYLLTGSIVFSLMLTGCFQGEQSSQNQETEQPQDAEAVDNLEGATSEEAEEVNKEGAEEAAEMVPRELYLLDKNGMVASQTIDLPQLDSKEVAAQVLEYLVIDGPVTSVLPNGFQAVLPAGTEILGVNLKEDGTVIVDVSEEFKGYEASQEVKILEAITHTLTQFDNVKRVQLWINGHPQEEMPVNGTPIGQGYTRTNGINVVETGAVDLIDSQPVTMYYPAEHNESRYYIPVTQYVETSEDNVYQSIVQALMDGPGYQTNVVHVFNENALLTEEPTINDGVLEMVFNQGILMDEEKAVIADEVMETLVRTLTEQEGVKAVDIKVENVEQLVSENGEAYTEPVTKQTYLPSEKL
ncbi:spore gernimation protein [Oceanobacillus piezotolerans]|uniref:Spore gernimation protein n=1 Tax=Oceanobacillus piezotolerans TaxID=2448030 RepID=A0A498DHG2_9BACI|nr:GerMN domain-containing protein [Oceanobacillus piezotolerans]RLL47939.1 spore gernimation protein [Oceanobacillus piezotolerans]